MTSAADRAALLRIAREAIAARVAGGGAPALELGGPLAQPGAAFVTLHKGHELRGCVGRLEAADPLARVVAECAAAAATEDARFSAVTLPELSQIAIEVSVLGPLERVTTLADIEVGSHGLVVQLGWRRGLLLPQVARERQWDRVTFVAQTCQKAGLPRDAWNSGAELWRFEAEVFGDASQR
jgi:AmmeMemoRadiSam system protein A